MRKLTLKNIYLHSIIVSCNFSKNKQTKNIKMLLEEALLYLNRSYAKALNTIAAGCDIS